MHSLSAFVAALIAAEGFLSTVGAHVPLEADSNGAFVTALATGEGLWYIVRQHVLL